MFRTLRVLNCRAFRGAARLVRPRKILNICPVSKLTVQILRNFPGVLK